MSLRVTQIREVLAAFLSQGKVLLDLLSQAVAAALGNPGGFKEKHGSRGIGVRLDEFASALTVTAPGHDLVQRARDLDRRLADVRDDLIVHPKGRSYLYVWDKDPTIETLFPDPDPDPNRDPDADPMQTSSELTS
jgi:hypothetical protein